MQTWTLDRRGWGLVPDPFTNLWPYDGPWHTEPDKAQWIDPLTDFDCLTVRGNFGAWCGYVGVPPGHRYHGVDFRKIREADDIHAYGGLNYSEACTEDYPEGVCHIPEPGRPPNVWWLGFDCGHAMDIAPLAMRLVEYEHLMDLPGARYITFECVRLLVADLAKQLSVQEMKHDERKAS